MTDRSAAVRAGVPLGWLLAVTGGAGAVVAAALDPGKASAAAAQDWPPFVLVAGLLLIGLAAHEEGLFDAAGRRLARLAPTGGGLYGGAVVLVAAVTAVLNLDTSVAFLTPVLVSAGRSRGQDDGPLLYGCVLLSNAASLLLPGSNLTNLIVAGHLHLSGRRFVGRMGLAWIAAVVVTALVVAVAERRVLRTRGEPGGEMATVRIGPGLFGVGAAVVLMLVLSSPALPVAAVGVAVVGTRLARREESLTRVGDVVGVPVLLGLLGVAVALGTAGRAWSGPDQMLGHLDSWSTAAVAAATSVLVNNLPAASLLAARVPRHPFALLVGLDVGPNLFVTGSLSWILWIRAARATGARPSIARVTRLGLLSAPPAVAAALAALSVGRWV